MEKVICSVCQNTYAGKVPKGGDGSELYPRKHSTRYTINDSHLMLYSEKRVCPGSFEPAWFYYSDQGNQYLTRKVEK